METKIISTILISTILGSIIGFSLSYITFNSQIQSLRNDLTNIQSEMAALNSTINEINSREWHLATSIMGNTDAITGMFTIKGKSIRLRWAMRGVSSDSWIVIAIYFSNGTLHSSRGSSGVYGSFACDIDVQETGSYYLNMTIYNVERYWIWIWDYY